MKLAFKAQDRPILGISKIALDHQSLSTVSPTQRIGGALKHACFAVFSWTFLTGGIIHL